MDSYRLPNRRRGLTPTNPTRYTIRRLSSLLVAAGAILAILAIALLEAAGASSPVALASGMVLFIGAAALATSVAANGISAWSSDSTDGARDDRPLDGTGSRLAGWGEASQLGPDPEQVIGRETGARV
jgi:hypothetical protein